MNQSVKYRGDCKTAPATPGLLNKEVKKIMLIDDKYAFTKKIQII